MAVLVAKLKIFGIGLPRPGTQTGVTFWPLPARLAIVRDPDCRIEGISMSPRLTFSLSGVAAAISIGNELCDRVMSASVWVNWEHAKLVHSSMR